MIGKIKSYLANKNNKSKISYLRKKGMCIGDTTQLLCGVGSFGSEPFLIRIGERCLITSGVRILTHDGGINVINNLNLTNHCEYFGKVVIGDNVFIGINSIIMPGITIGNNVIIGAGSIVTKDIPDNTIYAGVPAKFICSVEDYYNKNNEKFDTFVGMSFEQKKEYLIKKFC